ncbi:MAG: hypothetical protein H0V79_12545 [Actinobacteria bacterium]|nr:hypothetical protein [Actinomycetota bacterium]
MAFSKFELEDGTPADPPTFRSSPERRGTSATPSVSAADELSAFLAGASMNLDGDPVPVLVAEPG